jgi:hypothetical protein
MPHVTVHFDPNKISQKAINKLKHQLPLAVSDALCSPAVLSELGKGASAEDLMVLSDEIYVTQHQSHPTDQNASALEILIMAGQHKGRSPKKVRECICANLREYFSEEVLTTDSCVWVIFNEINDFGGIQEESE